MTFDELLGYSADDIDKLSPSELEKLWEPFYNITRPDRVALLTPLKKSIPGTPSKLDLAKKQNPAGAAIAQAYLMKQFGISPDDL